jgi:hypothetical protein
MYKIFLALLLFPSAAYSQGIAINDNVTTAAKNVPSGAQAPLYTVPYAQITVCDATCANPVPIYTDPGLTQVIPQPLIADAQGRFTYYIAPGSYYEQFATQGGQILATLPLQIQGLLGQLVSNPALSQKINQPAGTSFSVNNFTAQSMNNVEVASTVGDIGANVNTAIAALPLLATIYSGDVAQHCGLVQVPQGDYVLTATILKPNCVEIDFNESRVSYSGPSSAIIEAGQYLSNTTFANVAGGVRNLWLNGGGNDNTTGPTSSSGYVGMLVGGDPNGVTAPNYGAFAQNNYNVHIEGFQNGVLLGRFSSLDTFIGGTINNNNTGVWYPNNAYGSGEAYTFMGTQINNNYTVGVLDDACGSIRMLGGSIDYTGGAPGQPFYTGPKLAVSGACVDFQASETHFEQSEAPIINVTGTGTGASSQGRLALFGGELYTVDATAAATSYIVTSGSNPKVETYGTLFEALRPLMFSDVQWNATGSSGLLSIHGRGDPSALNPVSGNLGDIANWDVVLANRTYGAPNRTYEGLIVGLNGMLVNGTPQAVNAMTPGMFSGFNFPAGSGTADYFNNAGTGTAGGYNWYESDNGTSPSLLGKLSTAGLMFGQNGLGITATNTTWTTGATTPPGGANVCGNGSLYSDTATGATTALWVCQAGSWVAK